MFALRSISADTFSDGSIFTIYTPLEVMTQKDLDGSFLSTSITRTTIDEFGQVINSQTELTDKFNQYFHNDTREYIVREIDGFSILGLMSRQVLEDKIGSSVKKTVAENIYEEETGLKIQSKELYDDDHQVFTR